jgi:hypothetical protein
MAERGVPEIVSKRQRFGKIDVEIECSGDGARDLRHFDGVRQAVAKMVGIAAGEDLSFIDEAAKSASVDDTVAVALKMISIGMRRLRKAAPAGLLHMHRVTGQHERKSSRVELKLMIGGR